MVKLIFSFALVFIFTRVFAEGLVSLVRRYWKGSSH